MIWIDINIYGVIVSFIVRFVGSGIREFRFVSLVVLSLNSVLNIEINFFVFILLGIRWYFQNIPNRHHGINLFNLSHIFPQRREEHIGLLARKSLPHRKRWPHQNHTVICRVKESCPLNGDCLQSSVAYGCKITSNNTDSPYYTGLTENTFKDKHKNSFKYKTKKNSTKLSNYVWDKMRD